MTSRKWTIPVWFAAILAATWPAAAQTEQTVRVDLAYQSPGHGPAPNFSPYGTQVKLSDAPGSVKLPEGAARPAKSGTIEVGLDQKSWVQVLATADPEHPRDLCRLYIDRNRNGDFMDDGPPLTAKPTMNEKTKAWWSSFNGAELSVSYGGAVEPYMVNFWAVREGEETPSIIRYSVASWRSGKASVNGIDALVAVMDSNNDAIFDARDKWSVLGAGEKDAARAVLSINEARPTNRLMFVPDGTGKELVLEFRSMSPDGRSLTFAVVDRPVTKAADRAPDDTLASERSRPRATQPFPWISNLDKGFTQAKQSQRRLIVDFWTSWCGPCKSLDDWIWSDSEVAAVLNTRYVGVKLDGDLEKDLVTRYGVAGYPTILILDPDGKELQRLTYLPSREMLDALKR